MANQKLTDLTELTSVALDDLLYVVDVSDTTDSVDGTSKAIQLKNLSFTWSTSEQIWPFEKPVGGGVFYAKAYSVASFPNNTTATIAHGITGLTGMRELWTAAGDGTNFFKADGNATSGLHISILGSNIRIVTTANFSTYSGTIYFIYTRS